ncbi:MAG: hypothetical protein ACK551_08030 [Vampirovibrionales bacterium]
MFKLNYPLLFFAIALIPNVSFLLATFRFCKRRHLQSLPWVASTFVMPFIAVPSLYARFQPEDKQQAIFWRLFAMVLIMNLLFLFVAGVVENSGSLELAKLFSH